MTLVDTSALIEYYRPDGDGTARAAVAEAIAADEVAVNGIVQVELVTFAPDAAALDKLMADFQAFHWLDLDRAVHDEATLLGFALRRQGLTIPATDLIVAACAIRADILLYHVDEHYDQVAEHTGLRARHL